MSIFNLDEMPPLGEVQSVDTATVVIHVSAAEMLSKLQVNHLIVIRTSKVGRNLIGLVNKIMRKYGDEADIADGEEIATSDIVKATLIGTYIEKVGEDKDIFKRTLESVPEISSQCFIISEKALSDFMSAISTKSLKDTEHPLLIGNYTLNDDAKAWLDGNRFFQRHAVIVGSTGSGKSFTVATLIEQIAQLKSANALIFDIHGEYKTIVGDGIQYYKIASPTDTHTDGAIFLPYWLLTYDEMISMMLDRSDNNAPNQAMIFSTSVMKWKKDYLHAIGKIDLETNITLDSPVPYRLLSLLQDLKDKDEEMVPGAKAGSEKQGAHFGKLTRFIQRLEAKISDKRLNFMFSNDENLLDYSYMTSLCKKLMNPANGAGCGVKIIDFSEVPSDVLPLMVSLIARIVFFVQQWTDKDKIHPVALFCDEAHLYIPQNINHSSEISSLSSFERIAKEGRKYGVGLVVISQRPSEVNHTVLSQSGNFIAMRLTNADDQNVIKKLLPDSLGNFSDLLPILDIGEALVVGDSSLLPSRIKVNKPTKEPNSNTLRFWDEWSKDSAPDTIDLAVEALRKQSK
ncbi:MAG: ATP-binding protein [Oscillospiraceae bacterium]|nr:ATP-binding protein [Oscillospiraceae bacterium]